MALVVLEGLALSFWLLLVCVVGIANGPVGLVVFYEDKVQRRVIELGLTTADEIRRRKAVTFVALMVPMLVGVPAMVYLVNGISGFWDAFAQTAGALLIAGLFDRVFIDWWWVGRTRAWVIPGTEDLMPYIPRSALARKWLGTVVGFPILAALAAGVMTLIG